MNDLKETFCRKTKKGWECYDKKGNVAFGITKEIAQNQYYILYGVDRSPSVSIDINKFLGN